MSIKHRLAKLEQNSAALATPPHYYAMVGVEPGEDEDAKAADAIAQYRADHGLDESALVDAIILRGVYPSEAEAR